MKPLSECVREYMEAQGISFYAFRPDKDNSDIHGFLLPFGSRHTFQWARLIVDDRERSLRLTTSAGIRAPVAKSAMVNRLLRRANNRLVAGQFKLDGHSRELTYNSRMMLLDSELGPKAFARFVHGAIGTLDHFFPAICRVVYGRGSAADAIADVEQKTMSADDQRLARLFEAGPNDTEIPPPVKRGRGRPRKHPLPD